MSAPGRSVTLVLTTRGGELLGALPPYDVPLPWWMEVSGVVAGARATYGIDVTVLRMLDVHGGVMGEGGPVTYLAEVADGGTLDGLRRFDGPDPLLPEPLRLPYAEPGGPDLDVAWADEVLTGRGRPRTGPAVQQRTWNLSSIWLLPTTAGDAWLKVVPPFFAHEGPVLELLTRDHPDLVPPLLATSDRRVLLDHVDGGDNYEAGLPVLVDLVRTLVALQAEWTGRVDELLGLGAPDWRDDAFTAAALRAVQRTAEQLAGETVAVLQALVDDLPARFAAIASCGVPDTLVHGDFHPGNTVGSGTDIRLLDWGDCGAGNALLDQAAFTRRLAGGDRETVVTEWARCWRTHRPGCDPDRAAQLVRPVAALRQAIIYWSFLDQIEPSERVYHATDPADWLRQAAALATDPES